ncbi:hypothetical protein CGRA01v4_12069 [Colletotrichum graminicola]|nr:hypothetical protein CGRA01v4_12069 [Colletotrichum graminicola]
MHTYICTILHVPYLFPSPSQRLCPSSPVITPPHCLLPARHAAPQASHHPAVVSSVCDTPRIALPSLFSSTIASVSSRHCTTTQFALHRTATTQTSAPQEHLTQPLVRLKSSGHVDHRVKTHTALEMAFALRPRLCCGMLLSLVMRQPRLTGLVTSPHTNFCRLRLLNPFRHPLQNPPLLDISPAP